MLWDKEPEYDRLSQSIHRDENGIKGKMFKVNERKIFLKKIKKILALFV